MYNLLPKEEVDTEPLLPRRLPAPIETRARLAAEFAVASVVATDVRARTARALRAFARFVAAVARDTTLRTPPAFARFVDAVARLIVARDVTARDEFVVRDGTVLAFVSATLAGATAARDTILRVVRVAFARGFVRPDARVVWARP